MLQIALCKKAKIGFFAGVGWTPKRPEQDSGGPTHQYRSLAVQRCRQHALGRSEAAGVELQKGHNPPLLLSQSYSGAEPPMCHTASCAHLGF